MVAYNESIYFDRAIYAQDIRGSIAYARGNSKIGILTQDEFAASEKGFKQVEAEWESGKFDIKPGVHSHSQRTQTWRDHRYWHCREVAYWQES